MINSILKLQDIWKSFGENETKIDALKRINLQIERNSCNLILGPSGSGKSTLLNLISLMDVPTKGKIIFDGKNTSNLSKSERSVIRRNKIGIIYQRDNLFPYLNLLENVMVPMVGKNKEKAIQTLKMLGLNDVTKFPDEISIKNQQKAALARAIINNPSILLADEPAGELNSKKMVELVDLIKNVGSNTTVLMASNNSDLVKYFDNVFYLKDGSLKINKK